MNKLEMNKVESGSGAPQEKTPEKNRGLRTYSELFSSVPTDWNTDEGSRWKTAIRINMKKDRKLGLLSKETFQRVNSELLDRLRNYGVSEDENNKIIMELAELLYD